MNSKTLGELLLSLVEAKPQLQIYILVWSFALIHAPSAPLPMLFEAAWQKHERIHIRLDPEHPFYASHHQKLVCIDDTLSFCGGIDLTVQRWDTCDHDEEHPVRLDPNGGRYMPVHDVQVVVAGDAALMLSAVARERWFRSAGTLPVFAASASELWPSGLDPDYVDIPAAVARTAPAWGNAPAISEISALTIDALSAAKQSIYIETQYFAGRAVRKWMEGSLGKRSGPEIVVIAKRTLPGTLERLVMGNNRDKLLRHLRQADRHNRLRAYYPVVPGRAGPCEVSIHAKVMIIDDKLIKIGSSNLNNRSMGLDTECDIAFEAHDSDAQLSIGHVRNRLLGEHLGVEASVIGDAVAANGSLIRAIDKHNYGGRGLRPFPETRSFGPLQSIPGTWLLDPVGPFEPLWWLQRSSGIRTRPSKRRPA